MREGDSVAAYAIEPTPDVIESARDTLSIFDVAVVPRSQRWLLLASEAEFAVVMGEQAAVEMVVGYGVAAAAERFSANVAGWNIVPSVIRPVAEAAWNRYADLDEGSWMTVRVFDTGSVLHIYAPSDRADRPRA